MPGCSLGAGLTIFCLFPAIPAEREASGGAGKSACLSALCFPFRLRRPSDILNVHHPWLISLPIKMSSTSIANEGITPLWSPYFHNYTYNEWRRGLMRTKGCLCAHLLKRGGLPWGLWLCPEGHDGVVNNKTPRLLHSALLVMVTVAVAFKVIYIGCFKVICLGFVSFGSIRGDSTIRGLGVLSTIRTQPHPLKWVVSEEI